MSNSKEKSKFALWLFYFILIIFFVLLLLFDCSICFTSIRLPDSVAYKRNGLSNGFTFDAYENLPMFESEVGLGLSAELDNTFTENGVQFKPVLVNEFYLDLNNTYVAGSQITSEHIDSQIPVAVVSKDFIESQRLDVNAIGEKLDVFGEKYMIIGIYEESDGFLGKVSSDVYERVYIPYTCYENYRSISIDTVMSAQGSNSEKALYLLGLNNTNNTQYFYENYSDKRDVIYNFPTFFVSVLNLVSSVICLIIVLKLIKNTYLFIKKENRNRYTKELIIVNYKYFILRFCGIAGMIVSIILLVLFVPLRIVVFPKYIPNDNIFDFNFYTSTLIEDMQNKNSSLSLGNDYLCNLYDNTFLFAMLTIIVLFLLMIIILIMFRFCIINQLTDAINLSIWMSIVFLLSLTASCFTGFDYLWFYTMQLFFLMVCFFLCFVLFHNKQSKLSYR